MITLSFRNEDFALKAHTPQGSGLATEEDRDLYIERCLEAYDENFERPPDGNATWTSLYAGRKDRANLDDVKKCEALPRLPPTPSIFSIFLLFKTKSNYSKIA